MSSRALRKLQQDKLPFQNVSNDGSNPEEEDSLDDDSGRGGAKPKKGPPRHKNPFEMLDDMGEDASASEEVKEDDDVSRSETGTVGGLRPASQSRNKKKSKRRNKKPVMIPKSSEDNLEDIDEVTRSVREVDQILGKAKPLTSSSGQAVHSSAPCSQASRLRNLLAVDRKHLNPDNEMKKMFGARVVAENRQANPHRRLPGGRHRAPVRNQHWLVAPKPGWPTPGKMGLSMRFVDSDDGGNQYFAFEHSKSYQVIQREFFSAVESMHPDSIVRILNHHPYHIDSMLQMSDMCKMGEDTQMAAELIERTLYALDSAFHPLFNLAVGTSRLEYRRQENRAFFIALFRHLHFVAGRTCYRTSLEVAKLILGMDPEADPVGILLLLDFYAIRSGQYEWFIKLFEEWKSKNLHQLPNWAYGMALAYFHTAQAASEKSGEAADYSRADHYLQEALINFPGVLLPLLDKCSIEADKEVATHKYFIDAQINQSPGLNLLTKLYIGRSHHLWKQADLFPWLERCAHAVLTLVEAKSPVIEEAANKRKMRYQGVPRNIYRHVIMSEIQDATTDLPRELTSNPVLNYDPLPPKDSIDLYGGAFIQPLDSADFEGHPISVFFRSLLPNWNLERPTLREREEQQGAQGGALREQVNGLYEAMQELLGNLQLPDVPHEGADAEDGDSEDDQDWA